MPAVCHSVACIGAVRMHNELQRLIVQQPGTVVTGVSRGMPRPPLGEYHEQRDALLDQPEGD